MEEEKEKKRHGKKKRFRGKNNDRPREKQKDSEKAPVKEKNNNRDGKGARSQDQGRKASEERKHPARPEEADEIQEEKASKTRREPEEPVFEFTWADAWGLYGTGYHVVIKNSQDRLYLSWSVDLSYGETKIGDRLQEFLSDMKNCGVASWDGRRYTRQGIFDGDTWSVRANSLSLKVETQGTNEYPPEWKAFLKCLHDKWNIPVSKREQWE